VSGSGRLIELGEEFEGLLGMAFACEVEGLESCVVAIFGFNCGNCKS
jgi:hypothetical protein